MRAALGVTVLLAFAGAARADSPKLPQARAAIERVAYDEAQRLLVGALRDGGNSSAAVHDIYKLSAISAIVLGQRDVGEQYYRRWLALDPEATLPPGSSPKLREVFDAARAYIAAHGSLVVTLARAGDAELELAVTSDPLAMIRGARLVGQSTTPIGTGRLRLAAGTDRARVEVVDEYGNAIVELVALAAPPPPPAPVASPPPPPGTPVGTESPHDTQRAQTWLLLAVPAGLSFVAGVGCGVAGYMLHEQVQADVADSGKRYYTDVRSRADRAETFAYLAGAGMALGVVLAFPAAMLYYRAAPADRQIVPYVDGSGAGAALVGRF